MQRYANFIGYSDIHAHEVVREVSDKTLEVRRLKAALLNGASSNEPDALVFHPGGFVGHTEGAQRYKFEQDPSARVFRIRLHKDGTYRDAHGSKYKLDTVPREHYDFNF